MTKVRVGVRQIGPMLLAVPFALATAATIFACAPSVAATQADEDACRPDVFRLCLSAIPDETAIVACLNSNIRSLSPACHAVIAPSRPPAPQTHRRRQTSA